MTTTTTTQSSSAPERTGDTDTGRIGERKTVTDCGIGKVVDDIFIYDNCSGHG